MLKVLNDEVFTSVQPSRSDPEMWYWFISINGELYADGEEGSKEAANWKLTLNLNEWKEKLS